MTSSASGEGTHIRLGNVRWRAPEMQTGRAIGQFLDMFAYGLVVNLHFYRDAHATSKERKPMTIKNSFFGSLCVLSSISLL